jgi:NADPH-dependent curcumin reductase CurA
VAADSNRQWILRRRPVGEIADSDLTLEASPIPKAGDGELVVRTRRLSLDASNRIWMSDMDSYLPPVELDTPMRGVVMGEVIDSGSRAYQRGDRVMGLGTWSDYCRVPAAAMQPCPAIPGIPAEEVFGIYMVAGPTAYFGVIDIGQPKVGETLVVSGAAGAVGALAGQIAKAQGCRVIGIAGGQKKCAAIVDELGFDAAIDYKSEDVGAALRKLCPEGVDIYFDNVGGTVLDAVLAQMTLYGRVVMCGQISGYNADGKMPGPENYGAILMKRLKVQGFIVLDYMARYGEAFRALTTLHHQGKLKWKLHQIDGLENAVDAVRKLYTGGNDGKLMIKVSGDQ